MSSFEPLHNYLFECVESVNETSGRGELFLDLRVVVSESVVVGIWIHWSVQYLGVSSRTLPSSSHTANQEQCHSATVPASVYTLN